MILWRTLNVKFIFQPMISLCNLGHLKKHNVLQSSFSPYFFLYNNFGVLKDKLNSATQSQHVKTIQLCDVKLSRYLNSNAFTGPIPQEWKALTSISVLYVTHELIPLEITFLSNYKITHNSQVCYYVFH